MLIKLIITSLTTILIATQASAFCGFYVAKADTDLFNKASKVVLVRDENKTILTMANDYEGDAKEFAMVVPVPTFIEREQIHVTENKIIDHLDAYTAPRLVEYYDENPCNRRLYMRKSATPGADILFEGAASEPESAKALGVTIEAEYTVGEYDIQVLSAEQSDGLTTWLKQEGYKLPTGAEKVLGSYIKQDVKFFVAKVNLKEKEKLGTTYLRPLQVAFESKKFMLPIRLGTVNAKENQELFVFTLTRKGRVETTNYRTVKIPSNVEIPTFVKDAFGNFYKSMFDTAVKRDKMKTVFLEYAWDMNWCDPCAADPLSQKELRELGVFWAGNDDKAISPLILNKPAPIRIMPPQQKRDVFVTRLHLRYNGDTFPEDLMFHQTSDRENFQGRYIIRHPWMGKNTCEAATEYKRGLKDRLEKESKTLANITGWDINEIRNNQHIIDTNTQKDKKDDEKKWWLNLWQD